jgi:hypothetical protein
VVHRHLQELPPILLFPNVSLDTDYCAVRSTTTATAELDWNRLAGLLIFHEQANHLTSSIDQAGLERVFGSTTALNWGWDASAVGAILEMTAGGSVTTGSAFLGGASFEATSKLWGTSGLEIFLASFSFLFKRFFIG